ncbi:MerR family transcriptional regulator [Lactobacillus kefiranofaciens subsp. kefirgranum DSM 10550 = JCM 8572]|nr:MerR family transcriptional regulator [Lactobacillus kefiranofaciens subsp. kefirgranum DSM 10550 = JCM 8572]
MKVMPEKYSIGEVAKKLNMTPRVIRFYEQKNLVNPDSIGENGYCYYGEKQLQKLELINYLRYLNFSIKQIKQLLSDQNSAESIHLLIQDQIRADENEIATLRQHQKQLKRLANTVVARKIGSDNMIGIAQIMRKEARLTSLRRKMWLFGLGILLIEVVGIISALQFKELDNLSAMTASIIVMLILVFGLTAFVTKFYYNQVEYICPNCETKFIPSLGKFIFSPHTPKFRKLECPNCHHKSYCLEIAR